MLGPSKWVLQTFFRLSITLPWGKFLGFLLPGFRFSGEVALTNPPVFCFSGLKKPLRAFFGDLDDWAKPSKKAKRSCFLLSSLRESQTWGVRGCLCRYLWQVLDMFNHRYRCVLASSREFGTCISGHVYKLGLVK